MYRTVIKMFQHRESVNNRDNNRAQKRLSSNKNQSSLKGHHNEQLFRNRFVSNILARKFLARRGVILRTFVFVVALWMVIMIVLTHHNYHSLPSNNSDINDNVVTSSKLRESSSSSVLPSSMPSQSSDDLTTRKKRMVSLNTLCKEMQKNPTLYRLRNKELVSDEVKRLDRQYALKESMFNSGWVPGKVKSTWVSKLLGSNKDTNVDDPMTILVLGGSFTRGHGCGETVYQREKEDCSWPARLEEWLQSFLSSELWKLQNEEDESPFFSTPPSVQMYNLAEHGTASLNSLQQIGVIFKSLHRKPDMILIDFLVNDLSFGVEKSVLGFENLLIAIQEIQPDAQIMVLQAGCNNCIDSEIRDRQRKIVQFYDIPMMDYSAMVQFHNKINKDEKDDPDLLWPTKDPEYVGPYTKQNIPWPNFLPTVNVTHKTCCANNHPPWPVHQYTADSMAYAILHMLFQQLQCDDNEQRHSNASTPQKSLLSSTIITSNKPKRFHSQKQLDQYPSCRNPLTFYDAKLSPHGVINLVASNKKGEGWSLYEDKKDRPGWITTKVGSTLRFPVKFGDQPILAITYLRSYENIGVATVKLHSITNTTVHEESTLFGKWEKNVSLPDTIFYNSLSAFYKPLTLDGWNNAIIFEPFWEKGKENQTYYLEIYLRVGPKFKITRVVTC